jgi:hypothetical protein
LFISVDKAKGLLVLWILLIVFGSVCGVMCVIFPCIVCIALILTCDTFDFDDCCSYAILDDKSKQQCLYCRDHRLDDRGSCSCCQRLWCWRKSDIDDWGSCCIKKSDMGGADVGLPVLHVGDTVKSFRSSNSEDGACV